MPEKARPCSNNGSLMLHYHYLRYTNCTAWFCHEISLFYFMEIKPKPPPTVVGTMPVTWSSHNSKTLSEVFSLRGSEESHTFLSSAPSRSHNLELMYPGGKRICSSLSCPSHIPIPACWCWGLPGSHKHFTLLPKLTLYKYSEYDLTLFPFKGKKIACLQNTSVYMFLYQSKI